MKNLRISFEEQRMLEKMDAETLHFLKDVFEGKHYSGLKDAANFLIDIEKNQFFGENEDEMLPTKHAYARGKVAGLIAGLRLYAGAGQELARREKERKK